jgi:ATP-dependent Lon protease
LEVLDPEQNTTFHDNYLDAEYDLSKVLFIATANDISNISAALRDRMEMINIPGYILEDKVHIAQEHLVNKQREAHGIAEDKLSLTNEAVVRIIEDYTRESGVRSLDKNIAKIARQRAKAIALEQEFTPTIDIDAVEPMLGKPLHRTDRYDIADMVGVEHVACGFDYGAYYNADEHHDLKSPEETQNFIEGLRKYGFSEDEIKDIAYRNVLRFLKKYL